MALSLWISGRIDDREALVALAQAILEDDLPLDGGFGVSTLDEAVAHVVDKADAGQSLRFWSKDGTCFDCYATTTACVEHDLHFVCEDPKESMGLDVRHHRRFELAGTMASPGLPIGTVDEAIVVPSLLDSWRRELEWVSQADARTLELGPECRVSGPKPV